MMGTYQVHTVSMFPEDKIMKWQILVQWANFVKCRSYLFSFIPSKATFAKIVIAKY
jgi:hypothetical protein